MFLRKTMASWLLVLRIHTAVRVVLAGGKTIPIRLLCHCLRLWRFLVKGVIWTPSLTTSNSFKQGPRPIHPAYGKRYPPVRDSKHSWPVDHATPILWTSDSHIKSCLNGTTLRAAKDAVLHPRHVLLAPWHDNDTNGTNGCRQVLPFKSKIQTLRSWTSELELDTRTCLVFLEFLTGKTRTNITKALKKLKKKKLHHTVPHFSFAQLLAPRNWDQKPIRMKSTLLMVAIPSWNAFPFLQTLPHQTWKSHENDHIQLWPVFFGNPFLDCDTISTWHLFLIQPILVHEVETSSHCVKMHQPSAKIWCFPWKWSLVWQTLRFKPICHRMNRQWPHHLESQQLKAVLHTFKLCISSLQSNSKSSNGFSLKWHLHALKILLQFESPPGIRGTFMSPLKGESDSRA